MKDDDEEKHNTETLLFKNKTNGWNYKNTIEKLNKKIKIFSRLLCFSFQLG